MLLAVTALAGCESTIGYFMVEAPNRGRSLAEVGDPSRGAQGFHGVARQFRVAVGPPDASLLVWVIDPSAGADEGLGEGMGAVGWSGRDEMRAARKLEKRPPRGTVLVLHTYRSSMTWMVPKARALARRGYRCVLVDLRGHGRSTGEFLSFGAQDGEDLSRVIDELEKRGEIAGKLGVWGLSYGASCAVMLAARDERVDAVVSVSPFASMRSIVPHYSQTLVPGLGLVFGEKKMVGLMERRASEAGFDPDDADMVNAAARLRAPLLLMHGEWDLMVPPEESKKIADAAAKSGCEVQRITLPATGHLTMYFDAMGRVERESVAWFDRWIAGER